MTEPVRSGAAAARESHKLEAGGSNPSCATTLKRVMICLPPRVANSVYIQSILHEEDKIGRILESSPEEWKLLFVPL